MRLKDLTTEEMTESQRRVAEEAAAGKRGRVPAPLRAWLHSPELGARAQRLGEFCRYDTIIGPRLSELAILVVARTYTSHYEWFAHKREALKAGLNPAIVEAIATRATPRFDGDEKGAAVHGLVTELMRTSRVSDSTYAEAVSRLGEQGVVELVGVVGYYALVAFTLNVFEIGLPEGERSDLDE